MFHPDTREDLEARVEELRPLAEEFEFLQTLLYLVEEGLISFEHGRLYPIDTGWESLFNDAVSIPKED